MVKRELTVLIPEVDVSRKWYSMSWSIKSVDEGKVGGFLRRRKVWMSAFAKI